MTNLGRPKMSSEDKRQTQLRVTVTDSESERLRELAVSLNLTLSSLVREIILERLEKEGIK